jgi:hypothetical protein
MLPSGRAIPSVARLLLVRQIRSADAKLERGGRFVDTL